MTEQALDEHVNQLSEEEEIEQAVKSELKKLAHIRWLLGNRADDLKHAQDVLETTPEYLEVNELLAEIKVLKQTEEKAETNAKECGRGLSKLSGYKNRKPVSGVEVKEFKEVTLLDEDKAKVWLAREAPDAISIKKSKFNSLMKTLKKDFVEVKPIFKAQLASDLSQYLDEEIPF